jgi:hypothetical protein
MLLDIFAALLALSATVVWLSLVTSFRPMAIIAMAKLRRLDDRPSVYDGRRAARYSSKSTAPPLTPHAQGLWQRRAGHAGHIYGLCVALLDGAIVPAKYQSWRNDSATRATAGCFRFLVAICCTGRRGCDRSPAFPLPIVAN